VDDYDDLDDVLSLPIDDYCIVCGQPVTYEGEAPDHFDAALTDDHFATVQHGNEYTLGVPARYAATFVQQVVPANVRVVVTPD
jgi:hypothetical protein